MKTSTQIGLQTGPIDAFCPEQHILRSGDHTVSIADGSVYNQNAPYQLILKIQQGTRYITLVNDTVYWVTVVSNGSNIKVQCKCINSQEEPKCIEINQNFIETHDFKGWTKELKMHVADDNKAYLYFEGMCETIIEVNLVTQQLAPIPIENTIYDLSTNNKFIVVGSRNCTLMIDR